MEQAVEEALHMVELLIYHLQGYVFFRVIGSFLQVRRSIVCKIAAVLLGVVVCGMVIFPNDTFNITFTIPLFFVMLLIGYRSGLLVRASVILLFFPIIIGLNFLGMDIAGFIFVRYAADMKIMNGLLLNILLLFILLFWILFMKQTEKRDTRIIEALDDRSWLLIDIICMASLAAVISCVYFTPEKSYKVWLCMLACVVTNTGCIRLVFYLAESIRSRMEKRTLELQRNYYQELEANQTEIRRFRHDINNHFSVAAQLLEEGKHGEAMEYFRKLSGQQSSGGRVFCKNSIVNAVLNSKYDRAMKYGIDCFFHIEIEQLLFIDSVDVCTIFSNTLDNAIEACMQIERKQDRRISVKARCTENGYFSYEIRNSKTNEIQVENGVYQTSKREGKSHGIESHGIGIENVKEAVRRYLGTIEVSYTENEFCVVVLVAEGHSLA